MNRYQGSAGATSADQAVCRPAATSQSAATGLTCTVAANPGTAHAPHWPRANGLLGVAVAATATGHHFNWDPVWWVVAVLVGYRLGRLWWLPLGPCWWCKGKGTRWGSSSKRFGNCLFCKGKKARFRTGARTVAKLSRAMRNGPRSSSRKARSS